MLMWSNQKLSHDQPPTTGHVPAPAVSKQVLVCEHRWHRHWLWSGITDDYL